MNSKQKGGRGERELAKTLREIFPGVAFRRGVQYQGTPDSPDVIGLDGIHIECKRVESLNLDKAYTQAKKEAGNSIPTVMHRKNNRDWMLTLALKDVPKLIDVISLLQLENKSL